MGDARPRIDRPTIPPGQVRNTSIRVRFTHDEIALLRKAVTLEPPTTGRRGRSGGVNIAEWLRDIALSIAPEIIGDHEPEPRHAD